MRVSPSTWFAYVTTSSRWLYFIWQVCFCNAKSKPFQPSDSRIFRFLFNTSIFHIWRYILQTNPESTDLSADFVLYLNETNTHKIKNLNRQVEKREIKIFIFPKSKTKICQQVCVCPLLSMYWWVYYTYIILIINLLYLKNVHDIFIYFELYIVVKIIY